MEPRLDDLKSAPGARQAMWGLEKYLQTCGLEESLLELVRLRASQINGCAYCIDMHTKDARASGETEQRLYALSAWRETPSMPSAKERPRNGRRPSPWSPKTTCRMQCTSAFAFTSRKPNASI